MPTGEVEELEKNARRDAYLIGKLEFMFKTSIQSCFFAKKFISPKFIARQQWLPLGPTGYPCFYFFAIGLFGVEELTGIVSSEPRQRFTFQVIYVKEVKWKHF